MLLSVIMSVYNGEEFLHESIDSILTQTYKNFEFIIINDGSTDSTKDILNSINDTRVRVVHLEENKGVAFARNLGVELSSGNWIAVQDADDVSLPTRLEEQLSFILAHPGIIAVGSHIECVEGKEKITNQNTIAVENFHNSFHTSKELKNERFRACPLAHGSTIFSKEAFLNAGKYDSTYRIIQDYDLWMRMFELGPIEIIPKKLYQYKINSTSLSHKDQIAFCNELNLISTKYIRKLCYGSKDPTFIVFGLKENCLNFKDNVESNSDFSTYKYIYKDFNKNIRTAYSLFSKGIIDGVIILDTCIDEFPQNLILTFIHFGMKYNINLFNLYNMLNSTNGGD